MQPVAPRRRARVLAGKLMATHLPAMTRGRRWLRLILKNHKPAAKFKAPLRDGICNTTLRDGICNASLCDGNAAHYLILMRTVLAGLPSTLNTNSTSPRPDRLRGMAMLV